MFAATDEITYGLLCCCKAEGAVECGVDDILPGILIFEVKVRRCVAECIYFVRWESERNGIWQGIEFLMDLRVQRLTTCRK